MKRIVLCCDGTWNRADQQTKGVPCPTNVWKAAYLSGKSGDVPQVIFYDEGVGTGNVLDRLTGGAFGHGLDTNVLDAYRFLIANYEPGDEIFLLGFSRGAFSARSLAGLIRKCGILSRSAVLHARDAWNLYRDPEVAAESDTARRFRKDRAILGDTATPIRFIGVWDTVGALGIPVGGLRRLTARKYRFHNTELSESVETAVHALAIDERREPFAPALWIYKPKPGQLIEQMWFAGCHSDVGGGFPEDGLADVALQWILDRARDAGLAFDEEGMAAHAPEPDALGRLHDSRTFLFRVLPGHKRRIGRMENNGQEGMDPTQSIHPSVLQRWDADLSYRPANLRDWFEYVGDPRATT